MRYAALVLVMLVGTATADPAADETAAYENAKPVFTKYCASCHTKAGAKATAKKLDHFDMTTYPFGGHHATTIAATMRKVLAIKGGKPTMPSDRKGAVKGDELALIAAWCDAFDAAHKANSTHHHH
ncbi:MAG TPA: c-type cytochrome [Kofleriaceae bacterium]|nr:c-type cytochrome [Kofleriaceae bacterium]